ncbi:MAG: patatin-like phospholipase family protein [Acidobacteriota bacterium]
MSGLASLLHRLRRRSGFGRPAGPPVGLVLSGGAVRGAAHLGVLEVLHREGVKIDRIAGTSVGALVGAAYAAGARPAEILEEFRKARWLSIGRPRLDLDFRGLLDSVPLERLLRERFGLTTFAALEIPFRAVALDIGAGERVVLEEGDVARAVLASAAMVGLFSPVEIEGGQLIDGGYVDNLPVGEVRAMGARTVIAVDLLADPVGPEGPDNVVEIWQRLLFLLIRAAQPIPDDVDVLIRPELRGFSYVDFDEVDELYERGRRAAEEALPKLREALGR